MTHSFHGQPARRTKRTTPPGAPTVEYLEQRCVPATFTVKNLNDLGPGSLRQAILDANTMGGADTIVFKAGLTGTIGLTSGQIVISQDLAIKGPGANKIKVDGGGIAGSRIFYLNDVAGTANISISGLTLQNGNVVAADGAAIANAGEENLTLTKAVLSGNTALTGSGGALYSVRGVVRINGCTFRNNTAGAGNGGAINMRGGTLLLKSSTLTGNSASTKGGALYAGGFLDASPIIIRSCTVSGNTAVADGGGLAFYTPNDSVLIQTSKITGNQTINGAGGGVFLSKLTYAGDLLTIQGSTISGNTAGGALGNGGGIAVNGDASLAVIGSKVLNNTANGTGGGGGGGGGIYLTGGSRKGDFVSIQQSTISGNHAVGGGSTGGGLAVRSIADTFRSVTITGSTIADNTAVGGGGGAILYGVKIFGAVTIERTRISGNSVNSAGGGLSLVGYGAGSSGGFYGGITIRTTTVSGNTANAGAGGGVYFKTGIAVTPLVIENSTLSGNSSSSNGGGLSFTANSGTLFLRNSTIAGNTAIIGGGITFLNNGAVAHLQNSTIVRNVATTVSGSGGGIFLSNGSDVFLESTIVALNQSSDGPDLAGGGQTFQAFFSLIQDTMVGGGLGSTLTTVSCVTGVNPKLGPLASNGGPTQTCKLLVGSAALNKGLNFAASLFDQRGPGFPRTKGKDTDIGAFEL